MQTKKMDCLLVTHFIQDYFDHQYDHAGLDTNGQPLAHGQ